MEGNGGRAEVNGLMFKINLSSFAGNVGIEVNKLLLQYMVSNESGKTGNEVHSL